MVKFRKQTTTEILNITASSVHYYCKNESTEPVQINHLKISDVFSKITQWGWVLWLKSMWNR